MKLIPGCEAEYRRRHDAIWPELKALLKATGIRDYTIFLDEETHTLFAVQQQEEDWSSQDLGATAIVRKWWTYMADIMETNPDDSPIVVSLEKMFHLD